MVLGRLLWCLDMASFCTAGCIERELVCLIGSMAMVYWPTNWSHNKSTIHDLELFKVMFYFFQASNMQIQDELTSSMDLMGVGLLSFILWISRRYLRESGSFTMVQVFFFNIKNWWEMVGGFCFPSFPQKRQFCDKVFIQNRWTM